LVVRDTENVHIMEPVSRCASDEREMFAERPFVRSPVPRKPSMG
jgi:hypothetical protein